MNFGIIGAGMIAESHIQALSKLPGVKVRWVADINEARLAEIAAKYQPDHTTKDYHQILADPQTDAVIICTPPKMHEKMFAEALQAGKHTLIEKPLTTDLGALERMVAAAAQHPELVISECSARHARLNPKFRVVKELIESGALGEIYFIHHNATTRQGRPGIEYHPGAKWFLNQAIAGGGPFVDWGVYDLSFHLGVLADKPELLGVKAITKRDLDRADPGTPIADVEEHGVAFLEFSGGLKYYWERAHHVNVEVPHETRIYGTKGGLKFAYLTGESPEITFYDVADEGRGKARKQVITVDVSQHPGDNKALIAAYVEAVRTKGPPPMPLALAAKHLRIILAVYAAAKA
jgi:predicted dehydrogenase